MTVKEIVDNYKDRNIKLGANSGSSYIFCGTIDDGFMAEIESMESFYVEQYKKSVEKLYFSSKEELLDIYKKQLDKWNAMHSKVKKEFKKEAFDKYYRRRKKAYENAVYKRDNFTGILDKEIVEGPRKSILDSDTIIFLYDGYEIGMFWSDSEYVFFKKTGLRPNKMHEENNYG